MAASATACWSVLWRVSMVLALVAWTGDELPWSPAPLARASETAMTKAAWRASGASERWPLVLPGKAILEGPGGRPPTGRRDAPSGDTHRPARVVPIPTEWIAHLLPIPTEWSVEYLPVGREDHGQLAPIAAAAGEAPTALPAAVDVAARAGRPAARAARGN